MPPCEVTEILRIKLNGEPHEIDEGQSLSNLVSVLQLKPEQIAIELNKQVVRRAAWADIRLREHDQIEIVHFVGGGKR